MRKFALGVLLFMVAGFAVAGSNSGFEEVGICGGVTWADDPDSDVRLFLFETHQLPLLTQELVQIEGDYDIVSVSLLPRDPERQTSIIECAVVLAKAEGS